MSGRENFEILMATMNRKKISDIDWGKKNISSKVLLINQSDFEGEEVCSNIRMISCKERGSSKSRNKAIEESRAEICLIADDDVEYLDGYEDMIVDHFDNNPDIDIFTFQIVTPNGTKFNSGYSNYPYIHNWRTILKCASIEIAFRRKSIIGKKMKVNEQFGLGSKYKIHDEIIFLKEALDKGLKAKYIPIPIVVHPAESSGTDFNDFLLISKGAAFFKLFGYFAFFMNLVFAIKKHKDYKKSYSFLKFLKKMCEGTWKFIKENKCEKY